MWDLNSQTRDQTCISCIGRQILNHWTARDSLQFTFLKDFFKRVMERDGRALGWQFPQLRLEEGGGLDWGGRSSCVEGSDSEHES